MTAKELRAFLGSRRLTLTCLFIMPAESLASCPPCPLSSHHQDNKTTIDPWWKAYSFSLPKARGLPFLLLEIQRQQKEKKGHLRSPLQTEKLMALHRPDLALKLGLPCHLDTVRAHLQSSSMSKTVLFWRLFVRSATEQEWHSGPQHQSPPSGIYTPTKQGQKSHNREAGFDWLLPTALKTENWKKAHVGSFFKK